MNFIGIKGTMISCRLLRISYLKAQRDRKLGYFESLNLFKKVLTEK